MRRQMPVAAAAILLLCLGCRAWAALSADVVELFRLGSYDDIIAKMDKDIGASPTPDPSLLYARGLAAHGVSRYDIAEADLSRIGDYTPYKTWRTASSLVAQMQRLKQLTPPCAREVKIDDIVAYRVHWDGTSAWARAVIDMLPEAYRAVCGFYDVSLAETSVLIFPDRPQFCAYYQEAYGRQPHPWEWAGGLIGRIMICQANAQNRQAAVPGSDYFRGTITHELTHGLLGRYLGRTEFPQWLNEGLAMLSGSFVAPSDPPRYDAQMAAILTRNAVLPLSTLTVREQFLSEDNEKRAYTQAFSMARFIYAQVGHDGLIKLIQLLKSEGSLDAALKKGWDSSQQKLYDLWLKTVTESAAQR
jgi:hypothetical protein